ncbi:hypothetical protein amb4221 [Paramagnetospirillum magneticum AMB-1]|uniref:Uncharacterized protein n=1 Tax=Paramagnetospirillum magneticum (strain ATCC 700264 / AMB-1) TaxID=342108 RepID=Q2VZF0_PARM1|nr:hypothetical protein amb4221 [Paramagnetospirillum magneticum AMB-1]
MGLARHWMVWTAFNSDGDSDCRKALGSSKPPQDAALVSTASKAAELSSTCWRRSSPMPCLK